MKKDDFILMGIILLLLISSMIVIDADSHLHAVYEDTLKTSTSSPPKYISGLRFEENQGQTDSLAKFICRDNTYIVYLTSNGSVIQLLGEEDKMECIPLFMTLAGANTRAICSGHDKLDSRSNYFKGNDPDLWITNVPQYQKVKYEQIYEKIDLVYYVRNGHIEFDFILEPGSNPDEIRMDYSGVQNLKIGEDGNLTVFAEGQELVYKKPQAWQGSNESRHEVSVRFALAEDHRVYFELGEYKRDETLVIDPVLVYASYLGGTEIDDGKGIAVDHEGCAYITGSTLSLDFPATPGAVQAEKAPGYSFLSDVFVTKFAPDGATLIYSSYLGGYGGDHGNAIAVDRDGNAYITGMTYSHDNDETPENESFPLMNEYQGDPGSLYEEDVFLTKLNGTGSGLLYSTYLGGDGEDEGMDIALDPYGNAYITGINFSFDYPIRNAVMPNKPSYYYDAIVTKINPSLAGDASLIYSTYLGGESNDDYAYGIAVDSDGHAYITGTTESTDFPTENAFQNAKNSTSDDAFVTKLSVDGASYVWSTYLGGSGQEAGKSIAVDTAGNAYATGTTSSMSDFPVTSGTVIEKLPYKEMYARGYVTKFNPGGTQLDYSTYSFVWNDIALDEEGSAYVVGSANINGYPVENAIQDTLNGGGDIYIMKFGPNAKSIPFSTYLGGSENDWANSVAVLDSIILVGGTTTSSDFPVTEGAFQVLSGGKFDAIVLKIEMSREEFVVEVWQDSLNYDAARIPETAFDIYFVDLTKPENPFVFIESRSTDAEGFLYLPASIYQEGWPFLLRRQVHSKATNKENHEIVNKKLYDVYVDNLYIDQDGKIYPDYLPDNIEDTTETYMEHTWVGFNLVTSIEWPASKDYMDRLKIMFKKASSYLYDITNGQACLQNVAVYDKQDNFEDADILLHASNTEWPRAHVDGYKQWYGFLYMPPKFFGTEKDNVNKIYETPIELEAYDNYTTITHELGHYAFGFYDEYINLEGVHIYPDKDGKGENIEFGFMDSQYDQNHPMSSEMSWVETEEYQKTKQYSIHHATCWDYFREQISGMYGGVRAEIHTPLTLGLSKNEIVEGPSENELGVYAALNIIDETGPDGGERLEYLCKDNSDAALAGVKVRIWKKTENLGVVNQGKTVLEGENKGRIRLFGAEPGDELQFTATGEADQYQFKEILVQGAKKAVSAFGASADVIEVVLQTLQGHFSMLSQAQFDVSGNLVYETMAQPAFKENPTLEVIAGNIAHDPLTLNGTQNVYSGELSNMAPSTADLLFRATDSIGMPFFLPQDLDLLLVETGVTHLVPGNNNIEMWLDSISLDLDKLAVLGSDFPCPVTGLPDSTRRVSPVFSIHQSPQDAYFESYLRIFFSGDTMSASVAEAVRLYRWEDGWLQMPSDVDLKRFFASTKIDGPGIYAVFLDLSQSHVTGIPYRKTDLAPQGPGLHQNYPNPFSSSTSISYDLPKTCQVNLQIFDLLGKEVETIISAVEDAGHYELEWDSKDLPTGTYIIRLSTEGYIETKKIFLVR